MARANLKKDFRDGDKLYGQQLNNNFSTIEAALDAMNKIAWQDDPDESVTAFRGTTEQIQSQPIIDGQLLYDISTGETYTDYNGERVSTGSGNSIHIGADTPENDATQIWIDPTEPVTNIGTEVVNNLDGDETYMAPSVHAIKGANSYSTEEVKTNETWMGKPIYRKVITAQMATAGGTTTINLANYGIDASNVKRYEIYANSSTDSIIMAINPLWTTMTGAIQCRCLLYYGGGSSELRLVNASGVNLSSYTATVILEYTKTTDGSDS